MSKYRESVEMESESHDWNTYEPEDIKTSEAGNLYDDRAIFPPLSIVQLHTEDEKKNQYLREHCKQLHGFAQLYVYIFTITSSHISYVILQLNDILH